MTVLSHTLTIDVDGATATDLARGIAAAEFVFAMAGTSALAAATAHWRRDMLMDQVGSLEDMTAAEFRLCDVWEEAGQAALAATCEGWEKPKPLSANLQYWDEHTISNFKSVTWRAGGHVVAEAAPGNLLTKWSLRGNVVAVDGARYRCVGVDARSDDYTLMTPGDRVQVQVAAVGDPVPANVLT